MFEWDHLFTWSKGPRTVLRLRGTEVARLTQKIGSEQWVADLNQHLDWSDPRRRPKDCRSYETGRAGVNEWARRHAERLDREVAELESKRHRLNCIGPG